MENFKIGLLLKLVNDGDYDTEDSKSLLNKYEINEGNYLKTALKEDYIKICDIHQGTVKELKEILKNAGLVQTGNKETLIQRVSENVNESELKKYFGNDKYKLTPLGRKFLKDNMEEIEKILSENGEEEKKEEAIVEEAREEIIVEEEIQKKIENTVKAEEKIEETVKIEETENKAEQVIIKEEIKEEVKAEEIKKDTAKEKNEKEVLGHKDKFAKNYIVAGIIIIVVVICINMFL
ncbi:SAP domain-containing protein [Fusobacterium sp. THCT1E2]